MTDLLYLAEIEEAYRRTFEGRVTALPPGGVVLDRTLFYPTGGGQPCDRGALTGPEGRVVPVVEVVKSGGTVVHRLGRTPGPRPAPFHVGETIRGEVDWSRRHRHMRLHTAQHLVSAVLFAMGGLRTRKATMSDLRGIIDLEAAWPSDRPWNEVRARVGEFTAAPHPVSIVHVPRSQWEAAPVGRSGLVPLPVGVDPVRVIHIDGIDDCPCGGTHVRSTGELGPISLPDPVGGRVELTIAAEPPTPIA